MMVFASLGDWFQRLAEKAAPVAERFGGPGLAVVAFLDSSFLSLPEVTDIVLVFLVIRQPDLWLYYSAAATIGAIAGCLALYSVARLGGEAFLRKRFRASHVDRGLALFRRYGLLTIIVPAILPPPFPFKIFVLLAGVAGIAPPTFLLATTIGRGFRYGGEALLAYKYGDRATEFIRGNLSTVSIALAALVAIGGAVYIIWRRKRGSAGGR
jgi:membrane protein YqaA with SNARE-associated domain